MSDESSDEEEGPGAAAGMSDPQAFAFEEQDEIEYDPEARSVTLTLSGAVVSLDIEIQARLTNIIIKSNIDLFFSGASNSAETGANLNLHKLTRHHEQANVST